MSRTLTAVLIILLLPCLLTGSARSQGEEELRFTILHTGDEHSHLLPHSPSQANGGWGGFPRLAQAIAKLRGQKAVTGEPVVVVSAGDFLGGTLFSWLALEGQAPELCLMLEMGYDVVTLGNHEFDYGSEALARYLHSAGYPQAAARTALVASNLMTSPGHPLGDRGIVPYHLLQLDNGLRLGFLGLMGAHALNVTTHVEGVSFTPQHQAAREAVAQLQALGAEVIIALTHAGVAEDRGLARQVPGIHLIVGGHCHTTLTEPLQEGNTLIVQSGPLLRHLGVLELAFHRPTGRLTRRNEDILIPLGPEVPDHPALAQLVAHYQAEVQRLLARLTGGRHPTLLEPVAELPYPLRDAELAESALGNFVTDALRFAVQAATGRPVAVAVQPNGTLRGTVIPHQGMVSLYDLIWPLSLGYGLDGTPGYPVVSFYLTGEEIRRSLEISFLLSEILGDSGFLQFSGVTARYDPRRAVLFWIPVINQPLPTTRAVLHAQWEDRTELFRGDQTLYHVASDYYTATFIPMVGDILPALALVPKDAEGHPLADLAQSIVRVDQAELKVWQAVLHYVDSWPQGASGYPQFPRHYQAPQGRLEEVRSIPLWVGPLGLLTALGVGLYRLRRYRLARRRRASAPAAAA